MRLGAFLRIARDATSLLEIHEPDHALACQLYDGEVDAQSVS